MEPALIKGKAGTRSLTPFERLTLQWQPSQQKDRAFAAIATGAVVLALLLGFLLSRVDVPPKTERERVVVPERVAKFIREQEIKPKPPEPKPEPPKPKPPEPKPAEPTPPVQKPSEPVRIERERPKPQQPLTEKQQQAREKAAQSGLLAHMSELNDLIDTPEVSAQLKTDIKTADGTKAVGVDTKVLTANIDRGSGGVDGRQYAAQAGNSELAAAEVASARAALAESAAAFADDKGSSPQENRRARSEEEVTLVFDRHKGQLQSLYNRARRSNPTLKGKLVLAVTILPNGSVSAVKVVSSELKDQSLLDSLLARIRNFQFGAKDVDTITVNYPIEFLP